MSRSGLAFAIGAYGLWGFLPVYFIALAPSGPFEIVAWRVLLSLVFCALLIAVTRAWRHFGVLMRDRSVGALIEAAGRLFADYPDREATRRHAATFTWERTSRDHLEVLRAALGRPLEVAASGGLRTV